MSLLLAQLASVRGGSLTPVFGLLIDTALKGTLLIAAAAIVAQLLKDRSAAARHAAWTAAVIGHLALPVLTLMVPQWRMPLFPAPPWLDSRPAVSAPAISSSTTTKTSTTANGSIETPSAQVNSVTPTVVPRAPAAETTAVTATTWPAISILGLLWILGITAVLLRLAAGTWKVNQLARLGSRVDDGEWLSLTQRLANRLGITRPMTLLRGDSLAVPVTWGVVYPAVLLPHDSEAWPESRRRFVLVHEMAHVKRFDALTQLIAQITVAILWFDPFIWYAAHRMRVEREHACDDYVLRDGTQPSLYAGELLEMVQSIGSPRHDRAAPAFAALAMARRSEFEGRMLAILDPRQNRHTLGRTSAILATLALALLVLPLAALRPFHQAPTATSVEKQPDQKLSASDGRIYPDNVCDTATLSRENVTIHLHHDSSDETPIVEYLKKDVNECSQGTIYGQPILQDDRLLGLRDGAYVEVREKKDGVDHFVRATQNDNGTISFAAREHGSSVPYDDNMRVWFSNFLPEVLTEGGIDVPQRVTRELARGGVDRVLDMIASIKSASSKRMHYEALLNGRSLTPDEYSNIADHASQHLAGSATDLGAVLTRIASGPAKGTHTLGEAVPYIFKAQEAGAAALDHALDASKSRSDSVATLTQYATTDDPDMMLFALRGASDIDSDTDKRTLLETIAASALRRKNDQLRVAYFDVVSTMQSDSDIRAVCIAALPYAHSDRMIAFAVYHVVETQMTDDTDQRAVLITAIEQHLLINKSLRASFMSAAKKIQSSTDYTAVMTAAFKSNQKIE